MNISGFNSAEINSSVADVTVRAAVFGGAFAMGGVSGRRRCRVSVTPVASATAVVKARKAARNINPFTAQAVLSGKNSVGRRMLISGQANAQTVHAPFHIVLRVSTSALAAAVANARVARRSLIAGSATAQTTYTGHKFARNPSDRTVTAQATPKARKLARSLRLVQAIAQSVVNPRAARRSSVVELAFANGYVGANSFIRYQFDEPALEENTFIVGYENNIFYVR